MAPTISLTSTISGLKKMCRIILLKNIPTWLIIKIEEELHIIQNCIDNLIFYFPMITSSLVKKI